VRLGVFFAENPQNQPGAKVARSTNAGGEGSIPGHAMPKT